MKTDHVFLCVDDDPLSRDILQVLLHRIMGYRYVYLLPNSRNFLSLVHALPHRPTVFFIDIRLQPVDGFELLRQLRQDALFKSSRIIAHTAQVMTVDVDAMKDAGFDGLIGKPLDKDLFPDLLRRILAGRPVWYVS